jgi:glutamate:GABA antiporter
LRWAAGSPSSPGTLEELFGLGYDFKDQWGVSRATFEALTLGTLAVILLIALVGYALGRDVRERAVEIALETDATVPSPAT